MALKAFFGSFPKHFFLIFGLVNNVLFDRSLISN